MICCHRSIARLVVAAIITVSTNSLAYEHKMPGAFESHTDIGAVNTPGSVKYDETSGIYTISGAGRNIWGREDEFQFVWREISGDFILSADAEFAGEGVDPHRKMGWMIRSDLQQDSPYISVALHGDGLTSLQYRREKGSDTAETRSDVTAPGVLQLERRGDSYIMSVARKGEALSTIEFLDIALPDEVYVGLFISAHDANVVESARVSNVRITIPAPDDFRPYADYIGSRLEILDIESGLRRVVHTERDSLQAPNWTTNGQSLIYNRNGRLYRFDLATGSSAELNTDFCRPERKKAASIEAAPPDVGSALFAGAVFADGLDRAAFHGLLAEVPFLFVFRLLVDVGIPFVLFTPEILGRGLPAEVAVDALGIDIELAGNVLRGLVFAIGQ